MPEAPINTELPQPEKDHRISAGQITVSKRAIVYGIFGVLAIATPLGVLTPAATRMVEPTVQGILNFGRLFDPATRGEAYDKVVGSLHENWGPESANIITAMLDRWDEGRDPALWRVIPLLVQDTWDLPGFTRRQRA